MVAGGAIGGIVAVTGQASVWPRAFHKRCFVFSVWNVPVIVFMSKRRPTWNNNTGICLLGTAIRTIGACYAFPLVARSHVVQVFLAQFASAPRWVFTRRGFNVGRRAGWAGGTRGLAFDVLKQTGLALGTKTGVLGIAMLSRIAPKTHRTASVGQCGSAKCALHACRGIQLFRFPTLWAVFAFAINAIFISARFAWGSVAFDTSLG